VAVATPDHYATLGVDPAATPAEIRSAYRKRSRELHPDRNRASDATRQMAALNDAYATLSDRDLRADYDLVRPRPKVEPRPVVVPPAEGRGSFQPERLPDWYEFLDLRMDASSAQVIEAANRLGHEVRMDNYSELDEARLILQLRHAVDILTNPRTRKVYDAALCGSPPPPGTFAYLHENWYTFLGVRPSASIDRIAERVTELSARTRNTSPEYREITEAWRTLRDPALRREYDIDHGLTA
jgi:DnaJ-class molecular chaperone